MPRSEERDEEMRQALLPLPASCQSSRAPSPVSWTKGRAVRPQRRALGALGMVFLFAIVVIGYKQDSLRWQSWFAPEIAPGYAGPPPVRCPTGDLELETRLDRALLDLEASLRSTTSDASWGRTIWTSAKDGVVADRVRDSWTGLNERDGWTYTVLDDDEARQVIADTFVGSHPSSTDNERLLASALGAYDGFDRIVLKTDFLRYALLWSRGGVWTDSDTICMQPIENWIPMSWREDPTTHAILASERDRPYRLEPDWNRSGWTAPDRGYQLVQWTIATRPFSPLVRRALVLSLARAAARRSDPSPYTDNDILFVTGPRLLTDAALQTAACALGEESFGFLNLTGHAEPVRYGGIAFLPRHSFDANPARTERGDLQKVEHLFAGSWKQSAY